MKSFSKIKSLHIKNFRNIEDYTISFEDKDIISLCGNNESGKTSVTKALAVLGLNDFYKSQKDFIRNGTNGFEIELELEDGTKILRKKNENENSYYMLTTEGEEIVVNKLDASGTIPPQIREVLGLVREDETKEDLQFRTYENRLLFVNTPSSVNYKMMYNALKVENLSKGIKKGNVKIVETKQELGNIEMQTSIMQQEKDSIKLLDIDELSNMKVVLKKEIEQIKTLQSIDKLQEEIKTLNAELNRLNKIEEIKKLDFAIIEKLEYTCKLKQKIEALDKEYKRLKEIETIGDTSKIVKEMSQVEKLNYLIKKENEIKTLEIELNKFKSVPSEEEIKAIYNKANIINSLGTLVQNDKKCKELEQNLNTIKEEMQNTMKILEQNNISYSICSNCGTITLTNNKSCICE